MEADLAKDQERILNTFVSSNIFTCGYVWIIYLAFKILVSSLGGRSRYRTTSSANNPNLMYQDECDRRLRGVKDGGRRDSASYRDRGETDRAGYANGSGYGSPNSAFGAQAGQYTYGQGTYGAAAYGTSGYTAQEYGAGTYGASSTTSTGRSSQSSSQQFSGIGRSGQQPQPLMSQQFAQPPGATNMIGYMGQTAYQYPLLLLLPLLHVNEATQVVVTCADLTTFKGTLSFPVFLFPFSFSFIIFPQPL